MSLSFFVLADERTGIFGPINQVTDFSSPLDQ